MKEGKIISLLARELTGELNLDDKTQLDGLTNDLSFQEEKQSYQETWDAAGTFGAGLAIDVDASFENFSTKFNIPKTVETSSNVSGEIQSLFLKLTVAVTILMVGFFVVKWLSAENSTLINNSTQIKSIPIDDSNTLVLSPGTQLKWKDGRLFDLKGKAQINTSDPSGFSVNYEDVIISNATSEDLLIELNANDESKTINLIEGSFKVQHNGKAIRFEEGQVLLLDTNKDVISTTDPPTFSIDLKEKSLSFNKTPLSTVFAELESYFGVQFKISEEIPSDCHFTAENIMDPSINDMFEILHTSFNLGIKRSSIDEFEIYNISCR